MAVRRPRPAAWAQRRDFLAVRPGVARPVRHALLAYAGSGFRSADAACQPRRNRLTLCESGEQRGRTPYARRGSISLTRPACVAKGEPDRAPCYKDVCAAGAWRELAATANRSAIASEQRPANLGTEARFEGVVCRHEPICTSKAGNITVVTVGLESGLTQLVLNGIGSAHRLVGVWFDPLSRPTSEIEGRLLRSPSGAVCRSFRSRFA